MGTNVHRANDYINVSTNVKLKTEGRIKTVVQNLKNSFIHLLIQKGVIYFVIGFLLGRALILSQLNPFALPFFVAVFFIQKQRSPIALVGVVLGSVTISIEAAASLFSSIVLFLCLYKWFMKRFKNELMILPYFVVTSMLVVKTTQFLLFEPFAIYGMVMIGVEIILAYVLTLIFIQSMPIFSLPSNRQGLKTEEIVCFIIMLASVFTGTVGWSVQEIAVDHVMARYLVILFALVAGASIGSTVGVVTGLIFTLANVSSFYHMSLLAFAGLLGGLLKEGKKIGVMIGLLIATLLLGMYGEMNMSLRVNLLESFVAMFMLVLTPQSLIEKIAKYIPGTNEYLVTQQQYLRKMRDATATKVERFSDVFDALSKSFEHMDEQPAVSSEASERLTDYLLSNVTEKTCQTCYKKTVCWATNAIDQTYINLKDVLSELDKNDGILSITSKKEWDIYCSRANKQVELMNQELAYLRANRQLKLQIQESRRLVANQLKGVSEVMDDFAKEIQGEIQNHSKQETQILQALKEFGVHVDQVEIYSLEKRNIDIEMTTPFCNGKGICEKLIAPMLSDILKETVIVQKEECAKFANGYCHVTFGSAKAYKVEIGIAHAAKGGGFISGDSYSTMELSGQKYALAISDGMGNGKRAHIESKETLQLLQKILQSGIKEKVAIKSVNSVLSLRTTDEIFTTLDLAMVDLQTAVVTFLKIGSAPSYIKRANKVMKVQSNNLPMGMFLDFEVDVVSEELKAGDLLIMMSDGIYDGPKHIENFDFWMRRKIQELKTTDPQAIADLILEEVIRTTGQIEDDMTIIVTRLDHNTPKWASIPITKIRSNTK